MLINRGGHTVPKGTYWNLTNGRRVDITEQDTLPGDNGSVFVKMSASAMLIAGPVLGLLFAVFLPFIGIAMTAVLLGRKLLSGVSRAVVKSTSFGWRPVESYLDGKNKGKKEEKDDVVDGKK